MNLQQIKRVLETALVCSKQPLGLKDLRALFADQVAPAALREALESLARDWDSRGMELVAVSSGWRFQSRPQIQEYLARLNPETRRRGSRASQEILTIIAYRQPVTRGDIEDIRGVAASSEILLHLQERGWVEVIGHRESPGRPALYATTRQFLDDLGLASLDQLPELEFTSLENPPDDGYGPFEALPSLDLPDGLIAPAESAGLAG